MGTKKLLVGLVILIWITTLFSGCTDWGTNDETDLAHALLGTWKDKDSWFQSYTFFSNGTCIINGKSTGSYVLNGWNLTIIYPSGGKETFDCLLISEDSLRLTNADVGYIRTYEKQ